jgi:predicted PurR-regulated permease PerM
MITVIVLTTVFVLFLVFGALVVRDVYRQASGWPEHRWTDTDDARLARLLDAGRR